MQRRADFLKPVFIALCLAAGNALADAPAVADAARANSSAPSKIEARTSFDGETLVNRYTAMSLLPSPADLDPTRVVVQVSFPRMNTKTVGDAIRYLLVRTGYELVAEGQLHPQVVALLAKRLPDSQRALGPYQVNTMLGILIGPAFVLVTDHASRLVSFQAAVPTIAGTVTTVAPQDKSSASAVPGKFAN